MDAQCLLRRETAYPCGSACVFFHQILLCAALSRPASSSHCFVNGFHPCLNHLPPSSSCSCNWCATGDLRLCHIKGNSRLAPSTETTGITVALCKASLWSFSCTRPFFLSFVLWMLRFADQSALFRTLLLAFDNAFVDASPPSES
jgi:hypothetical protein